MDLEKALALVDAASNAEARDERFVEAMRFLRDYGVPREALVWFWRVLEWPEDDWPKRLSKRSNLDAARNRIRHLLGEAERRKKKWPGSLR